jgi:Rieske Fe-S protein
MVALLAPGALVACGESSPSGGGAPTDGGSSGGASGTKLAALSDVPTGSGLVVNQPGGGGKLLLVRSSETDVKAFNAACTHQGTTVDPPKNGTITCPNHGSQFDGSTGALKKGPANRGLNAVSVKVSGTDVVLA